MGGMRPARLMCIWERGDEGSERALNGLAEAFGDSALLPGELRDDGFVGADSLP